MAVKARKYEKSKGLLIKISQENEYYNRIIEMLIAIKKILKKENKINYKLACNYKMQLELCVSKRSFIGGASPSSNDQTCISSVKIPSDHSSFERERVAQNIEKLESQKLRMNNTPPEAQESYLKM